MMFIILPTQLLPWPKSFWKQFESVMMIEDSHYLNKNAHPLKLWLHRASMMQYFDSIPHNNKVYIKHTQRAILPDTYTMCHPTDSTMVTKYKRATFIDPTNFLLSVDELSKFDTSVHHAFYKKMRIKFDILMNKNKPVGAKWSFDEDNRKPFPKSYVESDPFDTYNSNIVKKSKVVASLSRIPLQLNYLPYPTTRSQALKQLKDFIKHKLDNFGPYEDAINSNVIVGYHSCLSSSLNIGLITPDDILRQITKVKAPISSVEGFIRQIMWREYIRMRYVLHGQNNWDYLKHSHIPVNKSWYTATTQIKPLDDCIAKVLTYAYAHHIERLMLLSNYAVLLRLNHDDVLNWFKNMFIDGYDWVMLNTSMIVCSLSPNKSHRYMTRSYINNGTYLKKMGLAIDNDDLSQLKQIYERFIIDNKDLCKKDYRLAAQVKRLTKK